MLDGRAGRDDERRVESRFLILPGRAEVLHEHDVAHAKLIAEHVGAVVSERGEGVAVDGDRAGCHRVQRAALRVHDVVVEHAKRRACRVEAQVSQRGI